MNTGMITEALRRRRRRLPNLRNIFGAFWQSPRHSLQVLRTLPVASRGLGFASAWNHLGSLKTQAPVVSNPFREYAASIAQGPGLFKFTHYLDIYQRHLGRFIGQPVHVAEIGVLGGGSLAMWAAVFGPQSHIYGIDIQPECWKYANDTTSIFIGDQEDRNFWRDFKRQVPAVDILIDDGGHRTEQQIVTLEEMLPHLRPGGVYICEDIHRSGNAFAAYAAGLADQLNGATLIRHGEARWATTPFQQAVHSIHVYPFMVVIEKHHAPLVELRAPRLGSEWPTYYA